MPTAVEATTAEAMNRQATYQPIVVANRNQRNQTRQARLQAVKAKMEEGKSTPVIAAERVSRTGR